MRNVMRSGWLIAVVLVAAAVVSGFVGSHRAPAAEHTPSPTAPVVAAPAPAGGSTTRPNIVFVLTDDLSTDLVRYMPNVQAMARAGTSFTNYTVTDSLCCPSRASIFTGRFPHNTDVFKNSGADGGFHVFHRRGEEDATFATALQHAGYRTALIGKYLNGYDPSVAYDADGMPIRRARMTGHLAARNWVPPGWTTWDAVGDGYGEFDYAMSRGHRVVRYGHAPADYGVDVISRLSQQFVTSAARAGQPFFVEASTFAPHSPYIPAPRDEKSFAALKAPRGPAWNRVPTDAPPWLAHHRRLSRADVAAIDAGYRQRVRSVQSVDRMVGALYAAVRRAGQLRNTVFVFSSDNGLHMGQYTLTPGKLTAFDTDVRVPLIVTGPGVAAGTTNPAVVQNVDLAPTFEALGGATSGDLVDGRSMVPLLRSQADVRWRAAALVEHHALDPRADDPDRQGVRSGRTPTYEAMRTATFTYVRYVDGEREYYDRASDPDMLHNLAGSLPATRLAALDAQLDRLQDCRGTAQCGAAEGVTTVR